MAMNKGGMVWLAAMMLALAPALAASDLEVLWRTFDCPPMYISEGPLAGQGFMDRQLQTLTARLPALRHRIADVTLARAWYEVEHQDATCILGIRKTPEREKVALFSRVLSIARGSRLVVPADRLAEAAPLVGSDGAVDLGRLASRADLRGGYIGRRDYGAGISQFLQDPARQAAMEVVPNERQLFHLLESRRIDFFFSYPSEIEYRQISSGEADGFSMLPIHDDQGAVESYVACSKTPAGQLIIGQVDRVLADPAIYAQLQTPRDGWTRSASLK